MSRALEVEGGGALLVEDVARRVRRLLPLSVSTVLVTTIAIAMVLPSPEALALEAAAFEAHTKDAEAATRIYEAGLSALVTTQPLPSPWKIGLPR